MAEELHKGGPTEGSETADAIRAKMLAVVGAFEADPNLRWWLGQILAGANLLPQTSTFSHDPIWSAYNAGVQATGLNILAQLHEIDPSFWPRLQLEYHNASPVSPSSY